MNFFNFFSYIKQRRALNHWLKEERRGRMETAELSDHIKRDIGLYQQDVKAPLTWREANTQRKHTEQRAQVPRHKERARPSSA